MNYWIFQGSPEAYKFDAALEKDVLKEWNVKQHITKIKKGDKAIIWLCGKLAGCYGMVNIITDPKVTGKSADNDEWISDNETGKMHKNEDDTVHKVAIEFIYNLFSDNHFISKTEMPSTDYSLETLRIKGFIQGKTNMASSKKQFEMMVALIENKYK